MSFYVSTAIYFLLHCDEWDRFVAPQRHKFVTGTTLLQLRCNLKHTRRKRILQDKQFHLQLKSEQKKIIQNVLERKDSMAVFNCYPRASERACVTKCVGKKRFGSVNPPSHFGQGKIIYANHLP